MVTPDKYYIVIGDQSKYEEHGGKPNDKSPRIYPNTTIFRGANYHPHMVVVYGVTYSRYPATLHIFD